MNKRSDFERRPKDRYYTWDPRAYPPLLSVVSPCRYAEPMCGRGDMVGALSEAGFWNVMRSDIDPPYNRDVFSLSADDFKDCDKIITNPPWDRKILHPLITHLVSFGKPVWLLFDSDWAFTKQSSPYIRDHCTRIVAVGRLKWVEGSKMDGKDNTSWYEFRKTKVAQTEFIGR